MRRREGDGVRWWLERQRLLGAPVPPPSLVLAWTSGGDARLAGARAGALVAAVEQEAARGRLTQVGAPERQTANLYSGYRQDNGPWTGPRFQDLLDRLARGEGDGFDLRWNLADPGRPDAYDWASGLLLSASTSDLERRGLWDWTLSASPGLFRDRRLNPAGQLWLDLLRLVGGWPQTAWAAVFHDDWTRGEPLPYERWFGVQVPPEDPERVTRGYYWANLLAARHLAALGGAEAAAGRCRELGLVFEPLPASDGRGEAAVVRSALPLERFDDAARRDPQAVLAPLRDLLAPLLPTTSYEVFYAGPALKVLREPGTAYRRVPPEIEFPWFEDMGELPAGMGDACRLVPDDGGD